MPAKLQFSVLVPLEDARGDVTEHLRTWTEGQSFPRDQFQMVVVVANGGDPATERQVQRLLKPQDALVRTGARHVVGLWREAAARARAPWLILTEAHCQADSGCLAATAEAISAEPDLDAAMFTHRHLTRGVAAELTARWFRYSYAQWSKSEWARLNLVGAAVRREAFREIDAFRPQYGLFCAHLLSAQLHERGAKVAEVPGAVVNHVYHETLREHHEHSADSARGECEVRSQLGHEFCDRYFGRSEVWSERLRYRPAVARQVASALVTQARRTPARDGHTGHADPRVTPSDIGWLLRELAPWLPAATAGARPRAAWNRLDFLANEFLAERLPVPPGIRWRSFLRAQDGVVEMTRLRWIHEHFAAQPAPSPGTGDWAADQLDDTTLVGAHAAEHRHDGWFRWTRPVGVLRLLPPPGRHVLTIDTHGMRGSPLSYVVGVYLGGRPLPKNAVHGDGDRLIVDLPAQIDLATEGFVVLCRPYEPRRDGSADLRRLGMPVFSVELRSAG